MKLYLGIDPGVTGGAALIDETGSLVKLVEFGKESWSDFGKELNLIKAEIEFAVLEKVNSMPGQGVASTFKFGKVTGIAYGLLIGSGIPFEEHSPMKWQRRMGCLTGGDKRIAKAAAQRLFPDRKWTLKNADAVLIAEYCRRVRLGIE